MRISDLKRDLEVIQIALARVIGFADALVEKYESTTAEYSAPPPDGTPGTVVSQLNRTEDLSEIDFKEIMKRKYGKGTYCKRQVTRKNGSIYTYYQGTIYVNGIPKTLTSKTVRGIESKLNGVLRLKNGRVKRDTELTFGEWSLTFLKKKVTTISPRYALDYERQIKHLNEVFGKYKLGRITAEQIENYLLTKVPSTQKRLYDQLRNIFADAVRLRKISENPCTFIIRPKCKQKNFRCYEFSEQNVMIDSLPEDYSKLFVFLCCTGLRISECLALTHADVTPKYIRICKTKDSVTNEIVPTTKNGEERKVIYHESLRPYINVEFWQTLTHRKVSRQFQPIYSQFKNVNLHSTRHTYASLAHFVGIDDKIIQNQLGHKTLAMTQDTYTNIMIPGESIILSYFEKLKEIIRFTR